MRSLSGLGLEAVNNVRVVLFTPNLYTTSFRKRAIVHLRECASDLGFVAPSAFHSPACVA